MQLLIDAIDRSAWLVGESVRIRRKLNQGERLECTLAAASGEFTLPAADARIELSRADGHQLFTGYLIAAPRIESLGVQESGTAQRLHLVAQSDEVLLDRKLLPPRPAFLERSVGDILRQLIADCGVALDTSLIAEIESIPRFASSQHLKWSELARRLATRTRAAVRVFAGGVSLRPVGEVTHTIDEASATAAPYALQVENPDRLANDLVVLGRYAPRAYVKDYFIGDGLTLAFNLSQTPFSRRTSTLLEDEFRGSSLDAKLWTALDPTAAISVSAGRLLLDGGPLTDGGAYVRASELLELGGALNLQHGEVEFTAASDGVIGGLHTANITRPNCLAGFRIANSGSETTIRALVNGSETGATITTIAGRRYALSTRIYATQPDRRQQVFHSSQAPAGAGLGGEAIAASARFILEVHEIDPANPGSLGAASTVLYDGVIADIPTHCIYALVNAGDLHGHIRFVRLLRMVGVEVRGAIPAQAARTRLVGSLAEGAECVITGVPQLIFFSPFVPVPNETIVARYRSSGRAIARSTDAASVNASGARTAIVRIVEPAARNAVDCEVAAAALLADTTQPAWQGSYDCWSDFLPNAPESDPLPGDAVTIMAPGRGAEFTATLREVEIAVRDSAEDRSVYTLKFANDAAAPLCWEFEDGTLRGPLEEVIAGEEFLSDLPNAEITAITSTTITADCGITPPAGGGIEVRRTDFAWGEDNDRNLIGRFTTQAFTLPRLARIQTYCVKQFDGATPRKYSRHATALHVDYPF
jgi:hypothetical protein